MIPRHLSASIETALSDTPVVLLVGARQCGKTTLVKALSRPGVSVRYLSLDDPAVLAAAQSDPAAFLEDLDGPVILDEVQQAPALFPVLRSVVDRNREPGRFLLTGSTHALSAPRVAEALVGRMELLTLWPLSQGEIGGRQEGFLDAVFRDRVPPLKQPVEDRRSLIERALRGGYPEPLGRAGPRRAAWFGAYVTTILKREVRDLAQIEGIADLPRLLELLAARAASLINFSEISRSAGIPQTTLKRYMTLLEQTFLIMRLPAWANNPSKRLVKAPKLLVGDTGLLAHLAGWNTERLADRPDSAGPLLENFIATEIVKQAGFCDVPPRISHFRTSAGQEVDLVIQNHAGQVVGVEVKARATLSGREVRGLNALADACGDRFHRGIVLYTGGERLALGPRTVALPMNAVWELNSTAMETTA